MRPGRPSNDEFTRTPRTRGRRLAALALALPPVLAAACGAPGRHEGGALPAEATAPAARTRPADAEAALRTEAGRSAGQAAPAALDGGPKDWLTDRADDGSLVAGLFHESAEVRRVAARSLANVLQPEDANAALRRRLSQETDEAALVEVLFALGQRRDAKAADGVAALIGPTGNASPLVRAQAATTLGRLADDGHTAVLTLRLSDSDPRVRGAAALALYRLDGRRYDHARHAAPAELSARDEGLATLARLDPDPGVRWRATYALAGVHGRPGFATVLRLASRDAEPLVRLFALRGLAELRKEGLGTGVDWAASLSDADPRVVIEACAGTAGVDPEGADALLAPLAATLAGHSHPLARAAAAEALGRLLKVDALDGALRRRVADGLAAAAEDDTSPSVRRAAAVALVGGRDEGRALWFVHRLARGKHPADRIAAANALGEGPQVDVDTLDELLDDEVPAVASAAIEALAKVRSRAESARAAAVAADAERQPAPEPLAERQAWGHRLETALLSGDVALVATAAGAAEAEIQAGHADPRVLRAAAVALQAAQGPERKEARQALRKALLLPPEDDPPAPAPPGRLLDRRLAEARAAAADPHPRVRLVTTKGELVLELDREAAPMHVANFLELAHAGAYDGLPFHRVVPNFVVQGLDPRGDGWGTAGRRLPDEISPLEYGTGTLGMPNAGEPGTGGCQVFLTLVPTPHLDGRYTVFGRVADGEGVLEQLEIGDRVEAVTFLTAEPTRVTAPALPPRPTPAGPR